MQGSCCALEDAVVLVKKLARAINYDDASFEEAFKSYGNKREICYVHKNIYILFN